jgi:type IV pilus assembly protein PilA
MFTVLIIIALLAAIAIPRFLGYRERAWKSSVQSDLVYAALHIQTVATDNDGRYPLVMPPNVTSSPDVVILFGAGASASRICLQGDHPGLGESIYYDSTSGGITNVAC